MVAKRPSGRRECRRRSEQRKGRIGHRPFVTNRRKQMGEWENKDGFKRRQYEDYAEYLDKQGEKLDKQYDFAAKCSEQLYTFLGSRLNKLSEYIPLFGSVVCLGARLGGEVRAFLEKGYFAVGVDINPGENNPYVLYGDFHSLVFPNNSVDVVYVNCLDHVLDLDAVMGEVRRILKPGGVLVTENKGGSNEPQARSAASDEYDCFAWEAVAGLIAMIERCGFTSIHTYHAQGLAPHGVIFAPKV